MIWSDEMNEMVKNHFDRGLTNQQSATIICQQFGVIMSRKSVAGKRIRMGLVRDAKSYVETSRAVPISQRLAKAERLAEKEKTKARLEEVNRLRAAAKAEKQASKLVPMTVLTATTRDAVSGLRHNQCRFPVGHVGDPGFHYCQDDKDAGSSYCKHHRAICTIKIPLKER